MELMNFTQEEIENIAAGEREVNELLDKRGLELVFDQILRNGAPIQGIFKLVPKPSKIVKVACNPILKEE